MFFYNISHATLGPDLSLGEEEGSGYVHTVKLSPRTAIMRGYLAISLDTMPSPMSCHI